MNKRRLLMTMCLTLVPAVLACGVDQGFAQSPNEVQLQAAEQSTLPDPETKKTAHQRRLEAKKRLQEALEARKAQRFLAPDKAPHKN